MSRKRIEKDLAALLTQHSGVQTIPQNAPDIFAALHMAEENVDAFLKDFAARFSVDMTSFLPYFHISADDTPRHRGEVPYLKTGKVAPFQPIAFVNLADAAQSKVWVWDYPEHRLKTAGWRDTLQYGLILVVALWIAVSFFI